jgi:hypothetical protein
MVFGKLVKLIKKKKAAKKSLSKATPKKKIETKGA